MPQKHGPKASWCVLSNSKPKDFMVRKITRYKKGCFIMTEST